ncbi:MAG: hypothetical protein ACLR53_07085 [Evtepia gabavorous]
MGRPGLRHGLLAQGLRLAEQPLLLGEGLSDGLLRRRGGQDSRRGFRQGARPPGLPGRRPGGRSQRTGHGAWASSRSTCRRTAGSGSRGQRSLASMVRFWLSSTAPVTSQPVRTTARAGAGRY